MNAGLVGGIVGSIVGLAGGLIGAYCDFKKAYGPRERRCVIRAGIAWLAIVGLFLALLMLLPEHRLSIFVAYAIILPVGIKYGSRRCSAIPKRSG